MRAPTQVDATRGSWQGPLVPTEPRKPLKPIQLRLYAEDIAAAEEMSEMYPRGSPHTCIREILHEAMREKLKQHRARRRRIVE